MAYTARQIEIIVKTLELINESGLQGFTTKNLSREMGISEPAIYRHFKNKHEILLSAIRYSGANILKIFEKLNDETLTDFERILMFYNDQMELFATNLELSAIVFSEEFFRGDRELMDEAIIILQEVENNLKAIVETCQKKGSIRDDASSEYIVLMIMGMVRHHVRKWRLQYYKKDIKKESREACEFVRTILT